MVNRDRAWRRYIEEHKVIYRLKNIANKNHFYRWCDINKDIYNNPRWINYVGTTWHYTSKTITTSIYDSEYKMKWGKKGKRNYYYSSEYDSRVKDKVRFLKLLIELGYKHHD